MRGLSADFTPLVCIGMHKFLCLSFRLPRMLMTSQPKFVSASERVSTRILCATYSPNSLIYSQKQYYTLRLFSIHRVSVRLLYFCKLLSHYTLFCAFQCIESMVLVELDEDFKIIRLVDQWDGNPSSTSWASTFMKKANARITPLFIRLPKDRLS